MKLTPEVVHAFTAGLLNYRFDNPQPTPDFHRELWAYCCLADKWVAIAAPRGHAKSTAVTLAYCLAAVLFRERDYVIIISDTETQSIQFLNDIKEELLDNQALRDVFFIDRLIKDNEKDIIGQFKDGAQFRITARSSGQSMRGLKWKHKRPNLILGDDLENDEIVMNQERREKFRQWFFNALLPCLSDDGIIRVVGTILHFDSLLERLMPPTSGKGAKYTKTVGLKQISTNTKALWKSVKFRAHTSFDDFTEILWKDKFPEYRLKSIRQNAIDQGFPEGYAQEYLNYPVAESNAYFRSDDFIEMNGNDEEAHGYFYAAADFAISDKERSDFTAIVVGKVTPDNVLHIVDVRRGRWDSLQIIDELMSVQARYNPSIFVFEKGQIEKAIGPFLEQEMFRTGMFINIHKETPVNDKPQRARAIQGRHRAGGVKFFKKGSWYLELEQEMKRFPRGEHDDQVDALAYLGMVLNKMIPGLTPAEQEDDEYEEMVQEFNSEYDGRSRVTGY